MCIVQLTRRMSVLIVVAVVVNVVVVTTSQQMFPNDDVNVFLELMRQLLYALLVLLHFISIRVPLVFYFANILFTRCCSRIYLSVATQSPIYGMYEIAPTSYIVSGLC